jgi:hypothetical protein
MTGDCAFFLRGMCVDWETAGGLSVAVGILLGLAIIGVVYCVTSVIDRRRDSERRQKVVAEVTKSIKRSTADVGPQEWEAWWELEAPKGVDR